MAYANDLGRSSGQGVVRPRVFASRCLGFEACRWNGVTISFGLLKRMESYVDFVTVCPEVEIGLGVPRTPVRIVSSNGPRTLIQHRTGKDVTRAMESFTRNYIESLGDIDGFILKSRSPSCGIYDAKEFSSAEKGASVTGKRAGFFGGGILRQFPHTAIEDEGRLHSAKVRDHFLTRLFALAKFREVKSSGKMSELVDFHATSKFLLMAHCQKDLRELGNIVANREKKGFDEVVSGYGEVLEKALSCMPKTSSRINVLEHGLGYFSGRLSREEKEYFLDMLEKYRQDDIALSEILAVLREWIVRFDEKYLASQSFFNPYPRELEKKAFVER